MERNWGCLAWGVCNFGRCLIYSLHIFEGLSFEEELSLIYTFPRGRSKTKWLKETINFLTIRVKGTAADPGLTVCVCVHMFFYVCIGHGFSTSALLTYGVK